MPQDEQKPMSRNSQMSVLNSSSYDDFSTSTAASMVSSSVAGIKELLPEGPILYKRSEIEVATANFSASHQIGSSAWRGVLRGAAVAIVRKPGVAKDFKSVLRNVCTLHHGNLVNVLGGCKDRDGVFMVYELVEGDDLRSCLQSKHVPGYTVLSTWKLRMQVALDVAKGLEYLHQHFLSCSVHKYLTSRNVLLVNETLRGKLALVGMSALTGEVNTTEASHHLPYKEEAPHGLLYKGEAPHELEEGDTERRKSMVHSRSVRIKGTHGYMPPEYLLSGSISQKYDVFTYGVVLLELLKGCEVDAIWHDEQGKIIKKDSLIKEVRSMMIDTDGMKGRLRLWIDPRFRDSYPVEDALKVVSLAWSCVDEDPQKRPQMSQVAVQLAVFLDSANIWEGERNMMTGTVTLQGR